MTTVFARLEGLLTGDLASMESWFTSTAWPFVETFLTSTVEEELIALKPLAEAAVAAVVADVEALNSPLGWGAAVVSVIENLAPQIAATGLSVANASLHTAVGAALTNLQAAVVAAPALAPAPAGAA